MPPSSSAKEHSVHSRGKRAKGHWADWKWELLLLALSMLSLVATVVMLYQISDSSIDSWDGYLLGPNAMVSILAAISKTTLAFSVSSCVAQAKWNWYCRGQDNILVFERFDQASKGPWGSLRLLGTVWLRHWSVLGALIILSLVAYEPFMQTIITQYGILDSGYPSAQALTGLPLRLDSGRVDFGVQTLSQNLSSLGVEDCPRWSLPVSQPDFGMAASVYNGFQNSLQPKKINASASCPTGNCTFGNFVSLGVCSKCADISKHITKRSTEYSLQNHNKAADFDNMCSEATWAADASGRAPAKKMFNYTTFSVGSISISNHNGVRDTDGWKICNLNGTSTYLTTVSSKNISQSYQSTNTSATTSFVLFQGLRASDAYLQSWEAWENTQPIAFECELAFCAKAYSSQYENGQLIEHMLEEGAQPIVDSYKPLYCSRDYRSWESQFAESNTSSLGNRDDFQLGVPEVMGNKYEMPPYRKFNISQATIVSTVDWFESTFGHKMIYPATGAKTSAGIAEILFNKTGVESRRGVNNDIPGAFAAVADSMSIWMRDRELAAWDSTEKRSTELRPTDKSYAWAYSDRIGTVRRWAVHFSVRWPLLALPFAVTVAGALYVVFTICETQSLGVTAWKDSALATIVYGLSGEENIILLKDADAQGNMECAARQMRVGLMRKPVMTVQKSEPGHLSETGNIPSVGSDENNAEGEGQG